MPFTPIILWPDSALSRKADSVPAVTDEIRTLVTNLWDTMYASRGAGLSAPQIGVNVRVAVVDVAYADPESPKLVLINPEIVGRSTELVGYNESCLSTPNQAWDLLRPTDITVNYLDLEGVPQTVKAGGILAAAIQHELDHLEGKVYLDHLSYLKKQVARKSAQKLKRSLSLNHTRQIMEVARLREMGLLPPPKGSK